MKQVMFKLATLAFSLTLSGAVFSAEQTDVSDVNCTDSLAQLSTATVEELLESVTLLTTNCPDLADQIVETTISLTPAEQHQEIMQLAANTGVMLPTDVLLAAIAGGGDPATLSEPTAGGNLAIIPPSAAASPTLIGGRNGGVVASGN